MSADGFTALPDLQFITRLVSEPNPRLGPNIAEVRKLRILQQRWVRIGTLYGDPLTPENSEWRDVPLVEDVDTTRMGDIATRRAKGLPDHEKPPLGQPPSWLQEQEPCHGPEDTTCPSCGLGSVSMGYNRMVEGG